MWDQTPRPRDVPASSSEHGAPSAERVVRIVLGTTIAAAALALAAAFWIGGRPAAVAAKPHLVLVTGGASDYWQRAAQGAQQAARDLGAELHVEMLAVDGDVERQTELIQQLTAHAPDGLAVCPLAAATQGDALDAAARRSRLVTFVADAPHTRRLCFCGPNSNSAGRLAARTVRALFPEGAAVLMLGARRGQEPEQNRRDGFCEATQFLHRGADPADKLFPVVERMTDDGDDAMRAGRIAAALRAHPEIRCVLDLSGRSVEPVVEATARAGVDDRVQVVTFDESAATLAAVARGTVHAAIVGDPYHSAYRAVRQLCRLAGARGNQLPAPGRGSDTTPCRVVRRDNAGTYPPRPSWRSAPATAGRLHVPGDRRSEFAALN